MGGKNVGGKNCCAIGARITSVRPDLSRPHFGTLDLFMTWAEGRWELASDGAAALVRR